MTDDAVLMVTKNYFDKFKKYAEQLSIFLKLITA